MKAGSIRWFHITIHIAVSVGENRVTGTEEATFTKSIEHILDSFVIDDK
jgi:hypothetical protein